MDARGIAARINDLNALPRRAAIALIIGVVFGVSMWSLTVQSPDLPTALWWPASGVTFFAVLASRGRRLAVLLPVLVLSSALNVWGGRPLELAIVYGFANVIEAWLVVWILTRGRRHAEFSTLIHVGRFVLSIIAGALTFAVISSSAAAVVLSVDPVTLGFTFFASHASAFFVIAPLALVPLTVRLRAPRWEPAAQSLALGVPGCCSSSRSCRRTV